MKVIRYTYSEALRHAAETFLINQFEAPTQFVEAHHLPDLVEAAMHIVTDAAWVQPGTSKSLPGDVPVDEFGSDDDEDEEDE